jgi:prepilin-type processing-associated H-X9-DG protein
MLRGALVLLALGSLNVAAADGHARAEGRALLM